MKEHAWKVCVRQKRTEGSNPSLSAILSVGPGSCPFVERFQARLRALGFPQRAATPLKNSAGIPIPLRGMERVRILSLKGLSRRQQAIVRVGQQEPARVWTVCRNRHQTARQDHKPWPNRDALQKATKGRFALHSQSAQMVTHAFLAHGDTAQQFDARTEGISATPTRTRCSTP